MARWPGDHWFDGIDLHHRCVRDGCSSRQERRPLHRRSIWIARCRIASRDVYSEKVRILRTRPKQVRHGAASFPRDAGEAFGQVAGRGLPHPGWISTGEFAYLDG